MRARAFRPATFGLSLLAFLFYLFTLTPSLAWGDGARLQLEIMLGASNYWFLPELRGIQIDSYPFARLGVASWDHPLYVLLGRAFVMLFPLGEPLFETNLLSALAAAATVGSCYRLCQLLTGNQWASLIGALSLAVSHTFWFHGVTAEVYALHLLLLMLLVWTAMRPPAERAFRHLVLFFLLAGLGMANHLTLALTVVPAAAYMTIVAIRWKSQDQSSGHVARDASPVSRFTKDAWKALALSGAFAFGFSPWWIQFLRVSRFLGFPLAFEMATWSPGLPVMLWSQLGSTLVKNLAAYVAFLTYQFGPVGVVLGISGVVRLWRRERARAGFLLTLFVAHAGLSANYPVPDRFAFHLPSYAIFALLISCGAAGLLKVPALERGSRKVGAYVLRVSLILASLAPSLIYPQVPGYLRSLGVTEAQLGIPVIGTGARDGLTYFLNPNKHGDDSAVRFARSTLAQLAPRALVLAPRRDREASLVLRYYQLVEGVRRDIEVDVFAFVAREAEDRALRDKVRENMSCRPLYLISRRSSQALRDLTEPIDLLSEANLFRVLPSERNTRVGDHVCTDSDGREAARNLEQLIRRALR